MTGKTKMCASGPIIQGFKGVFTPTSFFIRFICKKYFETLKFEKDLISIKCFGSRSFKKWFHFGSEKVLRFWKSLMLIQDFHLENIDFIH